MTMTEWDIHGYLVLAIFASAVLTFVLLLSMTGFALIFFIKRHRIPGLMVFCLAYSRGRSHAIKKRH